MEEVRSTLKKWNNKRNNLSLLQVQLVAVWFTLAHQVSFSSAQKCTASDNQDTVTDICYKFDLDILYCEDPTTSTNDNYWGDSLDYRCNAINGGYGRCMCAGDFNNQMSADVVVIIDISGRQSPSPWYPMDDQSLDWMFRWVMHALFYFQASSGDYYAAGQEQDVSINYVIFGESVLYEGPDPLSYFGVADETDATSVRHPSTTDTYSDTCLALHAAATLFSAGLNERNILVYWGFNDADLTTSSASCPETTNANWVASAIRLLDVTDLTPYEDVYPDFETCIYTSTLGVDFYPEVDGLYLGVMRHFIGATAEFICYMANAAPTPTPTSAPTEGPTPGPTDEPTGTEFPTPGPTTDAPTPFPTRGPLDNGLVAYYPFNGNAADESGNGHTAAGVVGATLTADQNGVADSAYYFDGVDDYIYIAHSAAFDFGTGAFSVTAVVNHMEDSGSEARISSKYGSSTGWQTFYRPNNKIRLLTSDSANGLKTVTGKIASTNVFVAFAAVREITGRPILNMYLDGSRSRGKRTSPVRDVTTSSDIRIGWHFKGVIDEIRIYNRSLTADEVQLLYDTQLQS